MVNRLLSERAQETPLKAVISPHLQPEFYIPRDVDAALMRQLDQPGSTIVIKAPRQVGKSSLLLRACHETQQQGKRVAYLDFQRLDMATLADETAFFKRFCRWLVRAFDLEQASVMNVDVFWEQETVLGSVALCTEFVEESILPALSSQPIVLAIDEVDRVLGTEFRSDFFSMLRNWHNSRWERTPWQQLNLILVLSTEPYILIENPYQSPFNVGITLTLDDFNREQMQQLNRAYQSLLTSNQLTRLMDLIGGHPYLAQQSFYLISSGQETLETLCKKSTTTDGPFAAHLAYYLVLLGDEPELERAMRQVIREQSCPSRLIADRLRSAGLVRYQDDEIVPRCQLYARYFDHYLGR